MLFTTQRELVPILLTGVQKLTTLFYVWLDIKAFTIIIIIFFNISYKTAMALRFFHRNRRRTRTVPYFDQIFESKFSKTARKKFKVNILSDRVNLALSESFLTFNICRVVFVSFDLENRLRYGTDTVWRQIRWKYSKQS